MAHGLLFKGSMHTSFMDEKNVSLASCCSEFIHNIFHFERPYMCAKQLKHKIEYLLDFNFDGTIFHRSLGRSEKLLGFLSSLLICALSIWVDQ